MVVIEKKRMEMNGRERKKMERIYEKKRTKRGNTLRDIDQEELIVVTFRHEIIDLEGESVHKIFHFSVKRGEKRNIVDSNNQMTSNGPILLALDGLVDQG